MINSRASACYLVLTVVHIFLQNMLHKASLTKSYHQSAVSDLWLVNWECLSSSVQPHDRSHRTATALSCSNELTFDLFAGMQTSARCCPTQQQRQDPAHHQDPSDAQDHSPPQVRQSGGVRSNLNHSVMVASLRFSINTKYISLLIHSGVFGESMKCVGTCISQCLKAAYDPLWMLIWIYTTGWLRTTRWFSSALPPSRCSGSL